MRARRLRAGRCIQFLLLRRGHPAWRCGVNLILSNPPQPPVGLLARRLYFLGFGAMGSQTAVPARPRYCRPVRRGRNSLHEPYRQRAPAPPGSSVRQDLSACNPYCERKLFTRSRTWRCQSPSAALVGSPRMRTQKWSNRLPSIIKDNRRVGHATRARNHQSRCR